MAGRTPIPPERLSQLVHSRERVYLGLVILASLFTYLWLGVAFLGFVAAGSQLGEIARQAQQATPGMPPAPTFSPITYVIYIALIILFYIVAHGHFVGHLRGNGVRVTAWRSTSW